MYVCRQNRAVAVLLIPKRNKVCFGNFCGQMRGFPLLSRAVASARSQ